MTALVAPLRRCRVAAPALALTALAILCGVACSRGEPVAPRARVVDPATGRAHEARAVLDERQRTDFSASLASEGDAVAGEGAAFEFRLVAGAGGVPRGGAILMIVPSHTWTLPRADGPEGPGNLKVTWPPGVRRGRVEVVPEGSTLTPSRTRVEVFLRVLDGQIGAGERLTVTYRPEGVQGTAQTAEVRFYVDPEGDASFRPFRVHPQVRIRPGPAAHVRVFCPSEVAVGASGKCHAVALDRFGNGATFEGELGLTAEGDALLAPSSVRFADGGAGAAEFSVVGREAGWARLVPHTLAGPDGAAPLTFSGAAVRVVEEQPVLTMAWGDPHTHSGCSDAFIAITPADLLKYAREVSRLDFAAVTDHTEPIWSDALSAEEWQTIQAQTRDADHPGVFAAILGQEWTATFFWDKQYPRGPGHRHILYPGRMATPLRADDPATDTVPELFARLAGTGAVAIPHHPLEHWGAMDWATFDPRFDAVAEVYSTHGGSECVSCGPPILDGAASESHSLQEALARGFRIGIVSGSDSHHGHPGLDDFPGFTRLALDGGGLTCARVHAIGAADILEAMRARRVYATTGARIYLEFLADGHGMGEVYRTDHPPELLVRAAGPADLARIEIVKYAEGLPRPFPVVFTARPEGWHWEGTFTDDGFETSSLYYVRVVQKNLEVAWSSPIWVDRATE